MKNVMKFPLSIVLLSTCLALVGCYRGESRTLDEIHDSARTEFLESSRDGVPAELGKQIEVMNAALQKLTAPAASSENLKQTCAMVGDTLAAVAQHSGFAVRPSMGELSKQYYELSSRDVRAGAPELRLLAARTYHLLASELGTTKFSL